MLNRRDLLLTAATMTAGGLMLPRLALAQDATAAAPAAAPAADIPDMVMGKADAPVTVIEYGSFTCPHCAEFDRDVFPKIRQNYIDTGKVKYVFREVYFDRYGLWASAVARCGGEMRFWGILDRLYATQRDWLAGGDAKKIADNLRNIGKTAGMTEDQVNACLNDADQLKGLVAWYQKNAEQDHIDATPSFLVDGQLYSNMPYGKFASILDDKLKS